MHLAPIIPRRRSVQEHFFIHKLQCINFIHTEIFFYRRLQASDFNMVHPIRDIINRTSQCKISACMK